MMHACQTSSPDGRPSAKLGSFSGNITAASDPSPSCIGQPVVSLEVFSQQLTKEERAHWILTARQDVHKEVVGP